MGGVWRGREGGQAACALTLAQLLNSVRMDEIMLFLVVFMGSPSYVKSSHLRSKLSEVLHVWMPQDDDQGMQGGRPMSARR